jgi:putative two-component system response regulator
MLQTTRGSDDPMKEIMEQNEDTLLIVEDNHPLREGIREILANAGYTVLTAANGQEALDTMKMINPDMIISDISMPTMDGFTFFNRVRARPDWVSIPFIFLTAHGKQAEVIAGKNLGAEDYLVKPLTRDELLTMVRARLERAQQLQVVQLRQAYESSLTMLANAIDERNAATRGHVERVTGFATAIAEQIGWQGRQLEQLRLGAILHDIGKIIIRENVLFKPGALDEEEWLRMKRHPVIGAEMAREIPFLLPAVPVIRHHHERWDGTGYPDRLAGMHIPPGARIVAVADSFDAMTSDLPYRRARSLEEGLAEIVRCARTSFDPDVVAAFQRAWEAECIQQVHASWEAGVASCI